MNRSLLYIVAIVALFTQACKLDPPIYGPPPKADWSRSYQPLSPGSFWKYSIDAEGHAPDTATLTVTGEEPVINNKVYHTVYSASKTVAGPGYIYNADHIISIRTNSLIYNELLELQYVNDTVKVGQSWTANVTDNGLLQGVPARMIGTAVADSITRTVNGITYPRVKHTRIQIQQDHGAGFTTVATYDYYINMGVGVIENDGVQADGTDLGKLKLLSYAIK
ncbi:hypothetical protein DYU05_18680 [Mucilaginibacter terrenus]|uniref:Uncharacterized protein n=1 Tax=Mucilaginibacter terrenus TaxID=2482727 RepID=A0A3E2NLH4_9SPHI|nr:hypothetical protein [Mucilaginibacter terrenus]RFZ81846.1 hypothetical protein DYU05_18680 [Mucilaginibacter terrenus]